MTDKRMSDRNRMRSLAKTIRDATRPNEGESELALEHCWDWLFALLEIETYQGWTPKAGH